MMNKIFYALVACIVFASCASPYRSGQTPDDVYYSPGHSRTVAATQSGQDDYLTYDDEDDNYLRMKVQSRNRWSSLDDYGYWNNPYYGNSFNFSGGYYSPYNSFGYSPYAYSPFSLSLFYSPFAYNSFGYNSYNPWGGYYYPSSTYVYYNKPNSGYYARPQNRSSLNGYNNRGYNTGNSSLPVRNGRRSGLTTSGSNPYNSYNNQGNRSTYNNTNSNRTNNSNANTNRNNYNNNSNSNPVRTFNNSNSSSSGSRSSSGFSGGSSSGGVSRPVRH